MKKQTWFILWASRLVEMYSKTSFDKTGCFWNLEHLFMSKVRFETLLSTNNLFERLIQKMCFNIFFTDSTFYILQHRFVKIDLFKSQKSPKTFFSTSPASTRNATFERFTINLGNFTVASLIEATQFIFKLELWSLRNVLRHSFPQAMWSQETQLLKVPTPILAIQMSHHWLMHLNLLKLKLWSPQNVKK